MYLRTVKHGIKVSVLNPTCPFLTSVTQSPLNLPSGHIQALNYDVWHQTTVAQYQQTGSESRNRILWQSFIPNRTHTRNQLNHFPFLPITNVPTDSKHGNKSTHQRTRCLVPGSRDSDSLRHQYRVLLSVLRFILSWFLSTRLCHLLSLVFLHSLPVNL